MFRIGDEFFSAACAAKMVIMAGMGGVVGRLLRIDGHAANRIDGRVGDSVRPVLCMTCGPMRSSRCVVF